MASTAASVDAIWTAFRALPSESREQFIERLLADAALREELEDLLDLAVAEERSDEPTRPLEQVLAEIDE